MTLTKAYSIIEKKEEKKNRISKESTTQQN
jgi:hypothetical protein